VSSVRTDDSNAAASIAAAIADAKAQHPNTHTATYACGHHADTMDIPWDAPPNVYGAVNYAESVSAAMDSFVDSVLHASQPSARDECGVEFVRNICIIVDFHEEA
jgi:hypothetical protein